MKVLYFTKSFLATPEELEEIGSLGGRVHVRNGQEKFNDSVEPCDCVAGSIPKIYKDHKKAVCAEDAPKEQDNLPPKEQDAPKEQDNLPPKKPFFSPVKKK